MDDLEELARRLCIADGRDPDFRQTVNARIHKSINGKGLALSEGGHYGQTVALVTSENWKYYLTQAKNLMNTRDAIRQDDF